MSGYHGKLLRVNLTDSKISEEEIPEKFKKDYLGGAGLATKYLWDEVPRGADPLGPDNRLIFMTGSITGVVAPSAGRFSVVAKSPQTGIWGQANSGGRWGVDFKKTGYDGVIFEGVAPKPVYLVVNDNKAELRDASHLWGKKVSETTKQIREDLDGKYNVACIGPAGENKVKYAAIMNDYNRAAGRCGLGAVMGSKNLKAIAARGTIKTTVAEPEEFKKHSKKQYELMDEAMMKMAMQAFGTSVVLDLVNVRGGFPTRNWQSGVFEHSDDINGPAISDKILNRNVACYACSIACGRGTEIKKGKYTGHKGEGPEYETVGTFGGMCFVNDLEAITMAGYLCNEYGIDTISAGSTIAFAMECFEKGIITTADTGGLELNFGDADIIVDLVPLIAKREGFGDILAEGSMRMSKKFGQGSEKFAMHVKGLELPAYDSRAVQMTGLSYATANRGGDHVTAYVQGPTFTDVPFLIIEDSEIKDPFIADPDEVHIVRELEDALTTFDCVGACKFMGLCLNAADWVRLVNLVTGWDYSVKDYMCGGERVYNLARAFSVREGLTAAGDTLPKRLLEEPLPDGPAEGHVNELPLLLDVYYQIRGWDKETGKPTPEKLRELGLAEVIPVIWG
ncbi:MAG TPA: aldehyde ferredoxin oxidoreductase family protein [Candidatus Limnocylindrales bacterium]|nr:aldehyde ferredoxin oxidoreductase family protein [Candidatus Limnocylindrales bacterium]